MSTLDLPDHVARTRISSGPGLLLAHGAGSSLSDTFGPILEGLAAQHTVVGIDYPGSGDTSRSTTPLSVDDLADQLVSAADAESLDRFAVSGFSLGGPVAIRPAARHPKQVTALVLTGSFPHRDNRIALAISVRTLVISTTKDWLTSTALHRQLADAIPGAELAEIETGHLPMLERTDEWLRLITDFLDQHNA